MNVKEYMKAKKLIEESKKVIPIKIVERGTGRNVKAKSGKRKRRRTNKSASN